MGKEAVKKAACERAAFSCLEAKHCKDDTLIIKRKREEKQRAGEII